MRSSLLVLLLSAPGWAQPYHNPVIPLAETEIADPYVLRYNGEYYLYASGDPIQAWHSRDLVKWKALGPVLRSSPGAWNEADVWAPEVVYRDGKFLMYYTASRKSADWRIGEMARRVGVAVSSSPAGPFVDAGAPVVPGWAIDGNVLRDPRTGLDYLFYSFLEEPEHPGAGILADRLVNWKRVTGKPFRVSRGSLAWEDKDGDPHNGSLRYTNEGPTALFRHGKYYCLYSGGSWDRPTYSVAYAVAENPHGPWRKVDTPILRSTALVDGPGHNALVKAPNNVDDMHFYHARLQPFLDSWNRVPLADRLYWNGDRPYAPEPTLGPLALPDRPLLQEWFDAREESRWSGSLDVVEGVGKVTGELVSRQPLPANFVLEVNFRGQRPGLRLGEQRLELTEGAWRWAGTLLRPWRNDEKFHQLLVHGNGEQLALVLDGVELGSVRRQPSSKSWSLLGPAEFDGVALTAAFDDDLRRAVAGWQPRSGQWQSSAGYQQRAATGLALASKGEAATRYEFQATLHPDDRAAPLVARPGVRDQKWKAGIVAGEGHDSLVLAGFDKAIWPLGRFWVQTRVAGQPGSTVSVGMPRGFRYDVPHTIRVVRQESLWTFYLDGKETATLRASFPPTRPGLFTENTPCTFLDAAWKQLGVEQNWLLDGSFECEAAGSAWQLTGGARLNESQPFAGGQRLWLAGKGARAEQVLSVPAGRYRLEAFAWSGENGSLGLQTGSSDPVARATGPRWERRSWEFVASPGERIQLLNLSETGVALDAVFLQRLP